jgi:hypothetical protein
MMLLEFDIDLAQQLGNTPMYSILDLMIWRAAQLEVDRMSKDARHREPELVEVCKKAGAALPNVKNLQTFEVRRDRDLQRGH